MLWRALVTIGVAALLAAADLFHKTANVTPPWGYHMRSGAWLALTTAVIIVCLLLVRVPSWGIAAAAGVLAGGAAGNALSAVGSTEGVPNPIVVGLSNLVIAFNLADVFTLTGILLLTALLVVVTIDHRERLEASRAAWRARRRLR
jgi:lipoprotein signal peptidase